MQEIPLFQQRLEWLGNKTNYFFVRIANPLIAKAILKVKH